MLSVVVAKLFHKVGDEFIRGLFEHTAYLVMQNLATDPSVPTAAGYATMSSAAQSCVAPQAS